MLFGVLLSILLECFQHYAVINPVIEDRPPFKFFQKVRQGLEPLMSFVSMPMLKSDIYVKYVKCRMSNTYVEPWDTLNNFCFHV